MKRMIQGIALMFAMAPLFAVAQGRPGGGQGAGQSQARGQQQRQSSKGTGQGQMDRDRTRQRLLTHATDQQRAQFKTCTQDMDQLRTRAHDMRNASGKGFSAENAKQARGRLAEQFRAMQQQEEQLVNGLDPDQKAAVRNRLRNMEQVQSRIATRLEKMNQELNADTPNQKRLQDESRNLEREMQRWQIEQRAMGRDLSLNQG